MEVLGVILRVFLKLGTCTIGGGLVAWIIVGGIVSLFFSTKVMSKNDFIADHEYRHNRSRNRGKCSICTRQIIEELPYTPKKNHGRYAKFALNPRVRVTYQPDWKTQAQAVAVYVGLLCGIAWAIENDKARWRFFWSSCGGVSVGWVVHLATGNASACWALILLGLFVGVVSSLAGVGAYGRK